MPNYKISGILSKDATIRVFINNTFIGYKEVLRGPYYIIFPFFKYDNFVNFNNTYWTPNSYGNGLPPALVNGKIKLQCSIGNSGSQLLPHGKWFIRGDFDVELSMSNMSPIGTNCSPIRLRVYRTDNTSIYNDLGNLTNIEYTWYRVLNEAWTTLGTLNITDGRTYSRIKITRVGSAVRGYVLQDNLWTQVGSTDNPSVIGTADVYINPWCANWSSGSACYCTLEELRINTASEIIPMTTPQVDIIATANDDSKLMGYNIVIPVSTTEAPNIIG